MDKSTPEEIEQSTKAAEQWVKDAETIATTKEAKEKLQLFEKMLSEDSWKNVPTFEQIGRWKVEKKGIEKSLEILRRKIPELEKLEIESKQETNSLNWNATIIAALILIFLILPLFINQGITLLNFLILLFTILVSIFYLTIEFKAKEFEQFKEYKSISKILASFFFAILLTQSALIPAISPKVQTNEIEVLEEGNRGYRIITENNYLAEKLLRYNLTVSFPILPFPYLEGNCAKLKVSNSQILDFSSDYSPLVTVTKDDSNSYLKICTNQNNWHLNSTNIKITVLQEGQVGSNKVCIEHFLPVLPADKNKITNYLSANYAEMIIADVTKIKSEKYGSQLTLFAGLEHSTGRIVQPLCDTSYASFQTPFTRKEAGCFRVYSLTEDLNGNLRGAASLPLSGEIKNKQYKDYPFLLDANEIKDGLFFLYNTDFREGIKEKIAILHYPVCNWT